MMKNSKLRRIVLLLAGAVLLVSLSVGATLAYLTDETKVVSNTFTVGKVQIKLDETNTDKKDKAGTANPDAARDDGNEYHLLPGGTYEKDPMITVLKGSENCYVRIIVTINGYDKLEAVYGEGVLPGVLVKGWDETVWPCVRMTEDGTKLVCEFRYKEIVTKESAANADKELPKLFTHIYVDGAKVTEKNIDKLQQVSIDLVGHAIQSDNFENANEAWTAFDGQNLK